MWRVRTVFQGLPGSPYLHTMYFRDTVGGVTAQDAVNDVAAMWGAIDLYCSTLMTWATEPEVAVINPANGEITGTQVTTSLGGTGGTSGDLIPFASQGLIRWRTGVYIGGREVRGRSFIPGLNEAASAVGVPTTTFVGVVNTAVNTFLTSAVSAPTIWSKKNGVEHVITSGSLWSQFAVLRSRRD